MNDKINTEQPLILQPQCVDCRFYDGFGACTEHGYQLRDNCEDFADMETIHKYVADMENYEKKYKKALSMATFYNNELPTKEQRKMMVDIFPELAESEDERIRKKLICFVENWKKAYNPNSPFDDFAVYTSSSDECDKILAWLEKQGKKLDADKVIEWLSGNSTLFGANWCHTENIIEQFKQDFDL